MRNARRIVLGTVAMALSGLLATDGGCKSKQTSPAEPSAPPPTTITLGHVGHDHQLALYAAALLGKALTKDTDVYLKEVKPQEVYDLLEQDKALARMRLVKVSGGSGMPAAMSRGEIQIGLGGTVPVAKFADENQPFKIICPLQTDGDMLVIRKDVPISDWTSFVAAAKSGGRPLRIGYKAPLAVAKLVFERALLAEHITTSKEPRDSNAGVILVNMGSERSPIPLLSSGTIDGFVMNQPAVAVAVHKGLGKVISELRDLPPKGQWINHPCCCVAATTETLEKHPEVIKRFLKVILLGTQRIRDDRDCAIDCASKWTKYPREVEEASVPTISYIAEPTESWLRGMEIWVEMMQDMNAFTGKYKDAKPHEVLKDLLDLRLCRQAASELRDKGMLGKK
jgi:NitT/TauT family transport system substrate-binding protein